jgi:hypothetical protein
LETDLDTAEDTKADTTSRCKDLESQVEELTRENKTLTHRVDVLEGMLYSGHQGSGNVKLEIVKLKLVQGLLLDYY